MQLQAAGRAGQQAFGSQALSQLKSMAAGFMGVGALVSGISRSLQVWRQNISEIAAEANKASRELLAFAALQEGGTKGKRVEQAYKLAQRYGIKERGVAFDTVQAMQSVMGGDIQKGMAASQEIFAATLAGMKLEDAKEVATLAAGLGFDPGTALRRAHAAGEASSRSPKELAKAAAGLKYWQDREVGWAAAATLAGTGRSQELRTYLKRGGAALSTAPGAIQKKFAGMGMGEAGQLQRLEKLAELGVTTPEAAGKFGFTEVREREAVSDLVKRLPELKRTIGAIREQAGSGLFQRERAAIEAEIPMTRLQRETDTLATMAADEAAFGPGGEKAQRIEVGMAKIGLALRRRGAEQFYLWDMLDEEGRLSGSGAMGIVAKAGAGAQGMAETLAALRELVNVQRDSAAVMREAVDVSSTQARQRPVQQKN